MTNHTRQTGCGLTRADFHPDGDERCADGGLPEDHPEASPKVVSVKVGRRQAGVAGQFGYLATVFYDDGDLLEILFSTNGYGGPFFAGQWRIDPEVVERCGGELTPSFIRRFYGLR